MPGGTYSFSFPYNITTYTNPEVEAADEDPILAAIGPLEPKRVSDVKRLLCNGLEFGQQDDAGTKMSL